MILGDILFAHHYGKFIFIDAFIFIYIIYKLIYAYIQLIYAYSVCSDI